MENKQNPNTSSSIRHYFVDEGGDSTLFSKTGRVLVGTEGCSRFFILGLLDVQDPVTLSYSDPQAPKEIRRIIVFCVIIMVGGNLYAEND